MQTRTSNDLHNAIIEAGSKDRLPMLARVITFSGNPESRDTLTPNLIMNSSTIVSRIHHTSTNGMTRLFKLLKVVLKQQLKGIDHDIYSTVDACPNACEMWKAIERLKQGESINVQDLETNLYWEFGKFTSRDGESLKSYYSRFYKMMNDLVRNQCDVTNHQVNVQFLLQLQPELQRFHQNEVNEIRAERLARTTNPLALVAQQQPVYQPQNHPTHYTQNSSTIAQQAATRNRGKAIINSPLPIYDQEPTMVAEDDKMSKDKEELEAHYMYMAQLQEVSLDAADNSRPIFDTEPLQKVNQDDDDDLANERYLLASLIEKLKCEIDDSKNSQSIRSSNAIALDSPYLLVFNTGASQSRQHGNLMKLSSVNQWTKILIFLVLTKFKPPQYLDVHPPSQEISDDVFQAKEDLTKSIQAFLEEFNYIPFGEKPKILLQAWDKFFAIQHAQPEDSNELFQKLLKNLQIIKKELIECNRPIFFDDNEDHYVQYKDHLENSSKEIAASNSNQEKEKPPKDSDIRKLIREECCIEVCEEQKHNMEDTILELVEICRQKELFCMHDNKVKNVVEQPAERRTRIKKSLQNFRVIHKSYIFLKDTSQISPVHAVAPILSTKEPEYSPSMGYEHPNTTPETELDEIIKFGMEELVPILSENEVTSEDKRECDMPVCENSPVCDDHSEIFSDSNNDDDILSDENAFEDIKYVEASLPNPEIFSLEEENVVHQEEEEFDLEEIQDVIFREKLLSINRLIANIESLSDNPTPDCVLNSSISFPIYEESDNSLSDNFLPEFKTFCDHTEKTRSGNITTHADDSLPEYDLFCFVIEPNQDRLINDISDDSSNDPLLEEANLFLASDNSIPPGIENFADDSEGDIRFLEELLIDDSIPFLDREEISVVMNNDELECLYPRDEFDDDDYSSF
nr:hypothetical protein [Tanacetum cinerariifolium]